MNRRLKVLVSAYACSPYKGSEPGVGWGFVSALSKYHDLWVIVEDEKFRTDIEQYLLERPEFGQRVHFFFIHKKRNRWLRKLWPPSYYWYYRRWHNEAYRLAQKLHREVRFDLAHQLTMVGFREPGYLWKMDIPFVWGPIGGMGFFPWRFLSVVGKYGALYYLSYNLLNWLHMNFLRRPRLAAKKATSGLVTGLILATPQNRNDATKYLRCSGIVLAEVGLPREPVLRIRERVAGGPLRLLWSGLHSPGKALNLALQALSHLPSDVNWELHILGEGRRTFEWQKLARELGIHSCCDFHGWVPRAQVLEIMQSTHLVLITSLRDLTSTVMVEALAFGLPIVCLDHCGFSEVIDDTCGVKIPVTTPVAVVADIAQAIEQLAKDETKRQALANGALLRAGKFSWEEKARVVDRIYRAKVLDPTITESDA